MSCKVKRKHWPEDLIADAQESHETIKTKRLLDTLCGHSTRHLSSVHQDHPRRCETQTGSIFKDAMGLLDPVSAEEIEIPYLETHGFE